jgi:glycosyltransferase involved in cell wall biosynthesis
MGRVSCGVRHHPSEQPIRGVSSGPVSSPLVSIVTPTLNQGDFIEHTLRSVVSQTYPNVEHIVIDGGSTDGTLDILRNHGATYPLQWTSGHDDGMYDAINKGLAVAKGDIVAYLNSDDLYLPWTLEVVAETLASRPDVDFVYGDFLQIDETTGRRRLMWQMPFDLDYVRRAGFLAQPAVFWRRTAYEQLGGFDTSLRFVADCDYWMRAGTSHRFLKVNEVLAIDREQAASLRQTGANALDLELRGVRSRYVTLEGEGHAKRMRRHRLRNALYRRWYGMRFAIQAVLPAAVRRPPWRHFLAVPGVGISPLWAVLSQIPKFGWRHVDRVVKVPNSIGPGDRSI